MKYETELARLNAYRSAQGLDPLKDFRPARHAEFLEKIVAPWEAMTAKIETLPADLKADVLAGAVPLKSALASVVAAVDAFDNDKIVTAVKEEEIPSYKEFARYEKSAVDKPVGFIHQFLAHHGDKLTRKEAVHALVKGYGINYSTARTQYQRWYAANKAK